MTQPNVLIVGGGAGLGAELVTTFRNAGSQGIGIIDRDGEAAERVLCDVARDVTKAVSIEADISFRDSAHAAFSGIAEALDRIDTLVNCAAIYPRRPLLDISDEDWDAAHAVNVKGTYHMMVAAAQHMRQQEPIDGIRGRIVNITSVDAFKAHPENAHYAATKAAVASLTRSFAQELVSEGILVNSVAPAAMATEKAMDAGFLGELAAANPLGRAAEPSEIAEWVLMAGGTRNTYMTGENIIVSGGYIYA